MKYGPVSPRLYDEYKKYGNQTIPPQPANSADSAFTSEQLEILDEVYEEYGQFSAWRLRNLTHAEPPWDNAYPDGEISQESMSEYFKTLLL